LKNLLTLIFFFFVTIYYHFVSAQEIEWQNTIGGNADDAINSIIESSDGGYLLGGTSSSNISGDKTENCIGQLDYWIVKINSTGNIQWENTIGGSTSDQLQSIIHTTDGGYFLGGSSNSGVNGDKTENSNGGFDYWVLKVDSIGNIQWQRSIGGFGNDYLHSVSQTSDGGYLLGGFSNSDISGDKSENSNGNNDYWIVKIDSIGNIQWQNTIGGADNDQLSSLIQTSDSGYILVGASLSDISGDKSENSNGGQDYWIVKTDSTGNIISENTIGGFADDWLYSVIQSFDNGYVLGGSSNSNISGDKTENCIGGYDYWIVKTDGSGNIIWQKTIGGNTYEETHSMIQTTDGGLILGGSSSSNLSRDKSENTNGVNDYWIVKTDSLGIIEWENTVGGVATDMLASVIYTSDGGYLLGGFSNSNISGDKDENPVGQTDCWVVKNSGNYNFIQGNCYADLNSNQTQETNDPVLPYRKITETNSSRFAFSRPSGFYSLSVLDTGNFEIYPDPVNLFNPTPLLHNGNFTTIQQIDSLNDFAFQPTGIFNDLCITITPTSPFRSGFNASYILNYSNQGTISLTPTIVFYPDSGVTFVSSSIIPNTITSDSVIFVLGTLTPFQSGQILITVNVNQGLAIGTIVNSGALILPIVNDVNPGCNSSYWEVSITGSFDPNDIIVNRSFIYDYEMASHPDLEYIIRFQNTGNDTAFSVKVLNPIDTSILDLSTLEFMSSSHNVELNWITWGLNMEFKFANILLPDSNVNEPMSHGYVRYRIKPKNTLIVGDSISNFGAIYFDFNYPVLTNTIVTRIIEPTSLTEYVKSNISVYPNPFKSDVTVELKDFHSQNISIELTNIYGQSVRNLYSGHVDAEKWIKKLDLGGLSSGVYILSITGKESIIQKIIKL